MVLVQIVPEMGKDNIRLEKMFELFEAIFNIAAKVRKETVAKGLDKNRFTFSAAKEPSRAFLRFFRPRGTGAKDKPIESQMGRLPQEMKDRRATADFNVVAVSAETKDPLNSVKMGRDHWRSA